MPAFLFSLLLMTASMLISMLLVKRTKTKAAGIEAFDFPQCEDGTPQNIIFGDAWADGPMVMWWGNLRTKKIKASGGKK